MHPDLSALPHIWIIWFAFASRQWWLHWITYVRRRVVTQPSIKNGRHRRWYHYNTRNERRMRCSAEPTPVDKWPPTFVMSLRSRLSHRCIQMSLFWILACFVSAQALCLKLPRFRHDWWIWQVVECIGYAASKKSLIPCIDDGLVVKHSESSCQVSVRATTWRFWAVIKVETSSILMFIERMLRYAKFTGQPFIIAWRASESNSDN